MTARAVPSGQGEEELRLTDHEAEKLWSVLGPASASLLVVSTIESILRARLDERDAEVDRLRATVERVRATADEWERRGEYGDRSLTFGAEGIRAALASDPTTHESEA